MLSAERWRCTRQPADHAAFRQCCRQTSRLIGESRRQHAAEQLGQCENARKRWTVVRELLHTNTSLTDKYNSPDMCTNFANFFNAKIAKLKSAIAADLNQCISPHISDLPCTSSHLFNITPVTSAEVFKLLSSLPSKTSVLDFVPTYIIKSC